MIFGGDDAHDISTANVLKLMPARVFAESINYAADGYDIWRKRYAIAGDGSR